MIGESQGTTVTLGSDSRFQGAHIFLGFVEHKPKLVTEIDVLGKRKEINC